MYKVFIDNTSLKFQKNEIFLTNISTKYLPSLKTNDFEQFSDYISSSATSYFISNIDPFAELELFFKNFRWIEAAGGIVKNNHLKKSLFIYRNGIWDLPKGKIEENESPEIAAIREIQEECGLNKVQIIQPLPPTFHVYNAYGDFWIKKTHWFELETNEVETSPQIEEDITEIKWFGEENMDEIINNTYSSLKELKDYFFPKSPPNSPSTPPFFF